MNVPVPPKTPDQDPGQSAPGATKPTRLNPAAVPGTWLRPLSRKGLTNLMVVVRRCPFCGSPHTFRESGLRAAQCRGGYLFIKARKLRGSR